MSQTDYVFLAPNDHTYIARVKGPSLTRVVFSPRQADIYSQIKGEIEVCSHNHFHDILLDPQSVLGRMQQINAPVVFGGWRSLKSEQAVLDTLHFSPNGEFVAELANHPAVRGGFGFINPGEAISPRAFSVLRAVFDVRAYVSPKHPDDPNLLLDAMGLMTFAPLKVAFQTFGLGSVNIGSQLAFQCCQGWQNLSIDSFIATYYSRSLVRASEEFKDCVKANNIAIWRTTRFFMEFVYKTMRAGLGDAEFDYEEFFELESECESFAKYIKQVDNCA